ncbi:MAG: HAD hydrolase family protein [Alkalibacterium thalassium]|nr:HAD hydrolase family protein [Alkalibacterium thalassium]
MTKIVFFDIDGTLVTKRNTIPESAKKAIDQLKKK